jgi:5,10-methylenetetrahydromethanopterin reductase
MDVGLLLAGGGTTMSEMVEIAQEAENAGVDSVYIAEAWRSAFVPLAAIAAGTNRIRIGPHVVNAYGRSPWITGMSAIDLNELSGGRLHLCVGTGNKHINADWQGIEPERPLKKMEEYATLLKQIVQTRVGESVSWQGEIHGMEWPPAVEPQEEAIPVFLAAFYPKMLEVAARTADGISLGGLLSADYIRNSFRPRAEAAAAAAGRDPATLQYKMAPFASVDDDVEVARRATREAICHTFAPLSHPYLAYAMRESRFADVTDAVADHIADGEFDRACDAIPDRLLDELTICGTEAQCRDQLNAFDGLIDEVLLVNVNYSAATTEGLLPAFRQLIDFAGKPQI